jgi:glutamate N-acetyltransferase/amino-acid N-acetyltransferase
MDCLGYSGAHVEQDRIEVFYDGLCAVKDGAAGPARPEDLSRIAGQADYTIDIHLHQGSGEAVVYTCECSEEYVRINV